MPSKPKQTTKEQLAERPELHLPKVILQVMGILFIGLGGAKILIDKDITMWEGVIVLAFLIVGTLMVIPKVVMPVLRMIQEKIPSIGTR